MVSENKVRELLQQQESDILDFKREPHSFSDEKKTSGFIKDILAMANTPREEAAYIVIGVDCLNDGSGKKVYCGVTDHPDDNDLQQKMNRALVDPRPNFVYQPIKIDGISYGIIEIFPEKEGPYVAMKNFGSIVAYQIYFRAGTQNKDATTNEERHIWKWFLRESFPKTPPSEILTSAIEPIPSWPEFLQACYGFNKDRLYLFILGPDKEKQVTKDEWKLLGQLPLSLVLDFDPETREEGAYRYSSPILENSRAVHLKTYDDGHEFVPDKACCWYAARGFSGYRESLAEADWQQWNRKYGKHIRRLIENLQRNSGGRFLTVVCLWDALEYVNVICTIIDENFGDNVNYVFTAFTLENFKNVTVSFNSTVLPMSLSNVLVGIPRYLVSSEKDAAQIITLPKIHGQEYLLSNQRVHQLSEDLEVLHSLIEMEDIAESRTIGRDFLRGMTVSWRDLSEQYAAERGQTDQVIDIIKNELNVRTAVRVNLYHWPGSGGTTVGRQVAWEMHRKTPTVLLKHIIPRVTIGRLRLIFEATELSILAVYEAADIEQNLVEALFSEAREDNIPIVFLAVARSTAILTSNNNSSKRPISERSKFISQYLSGTEAFQFANAYKRVVPEKSAILDMLKNSARTPFWFALTAFDADFIGITPYVERRLEMATELQRDLLAFLALAYYYGHKSIRLSIFAEYLGLHYTLHMERFFRQPALLELLIDDGDNRCRPAHYLIAEQILQIVLAGSGERKNWQVGLSAWAKQFIEVCSQGELEASDELIDLLRNLFVRRNEHELPETETSETTRFSPLMEAIRKISHDSQEVIFQTLVNCFPSIAHFRGHLARFYSIEGQPHLALEEIKQAIEIAPKDPLLHHMKGMCYRRQATSIMNNVKKEMLKNQQHNPLSQRQSNLSENELQITVKNAKESFEDALNFALDYGIDFASTVEYSYTSQIQLLLDVLDFGYITSGFQKRTDFILSPLSSWYQEQLDDVEYLMDQLKNFRGGDRPSHYILERQKELDAIYDDHSLALQRWNSLTASARTTKHAAIIHRQIVVNLLERARKARSQQEGKEFRRSSSLLSLHDRQRAADLLEENLKINPSSERDIREWFMIVRYLPSIDMANVIEKVAIWRATGDSLEADYYLYILYVLQALDGNTTRLSQTRELIRQTRTKAFSQNTRRSTSTYSFEWFGKGQGLMRLKHHTDLGPFDRENFYEDTSLFVPVPGTVKFIEDQSSGIIELDCGIDAFFVPSRVNPQGLQKGIDEYAKVSFYLGFSYSGLRAWSVERLDLTSD